MKPCDCKSMNDINTKLDHSVLTFNNESIEILSGIVRISITGATLSLSMARFKRFAEWYLEDQSGCSGCEHYNG